MLVSASCSPYPFPSYLTLRSQCAPKHCLVATDQIRPLIKSSIELSRPATFTDFPRPTPPRVWSQTKAQSKLLVRAFGWYLHSPFRCLSRLGGSRAQLETHPSSFVSSQVLDSTVAWTERDLLVSRRYDVGVIGDATAKDSKPSGLADSAIPRARANISPSFIERSPVTYGACRGSSEILPTQRHSTLLSDSPARSDGLMTELTSIPL